ncbi:hypothetical protein QBC42DRAFT_190312, partial [Cladorrhinum samala]
QVNIREQLRQILGQKAAFRGVQEPALIVIVIRTEGGKSILFMLPARYSGGLTVIIVPLILLQSDIKDRYNQLRIECASVILVTLELTVGESFGHFINRQRAIGRLDRIIINKYHIILDSRTDGG